MAQRMGTAEVMALIRERQGGGFKGREVEAASGFRPVRIEAVARLDAPAAPPPDTDEVMEVAATPEPDPAAVLAEAVAAARAEGFAEGQATGFAEGMAQGLREGAAGAEASVLAAREAFVALASRLAGAEVEGAAELAAALRGAVCRMASARAGQVIDALPQGFLARIDGLAEQVAQGVRPVTLALHPDDLAAIRPLLPGSALEGVAMTGDARLARGDAIVRAEGIVLSDVIGAEEWA